MNKPKLAITVGIPQAGKTTLCRNLMDTEGYVIVSPNTVRLAIHGNQYIQFAEPFVWATVETMARTLLMEGHKVIIDATNTHLEARKKWINMAKEFGIELDIFLMMTSTEICFERNSLLAIPYDNKIMNKMCDQFVYPTEEEGTIARVV
jgi:predicted kinase